MNRLFFGFLAAGTALGASAFTNVESHTTPLNGRALAQGYFVQRAANSYTYVSTATHKQGSCIEETTRPCSYILPAENSVPGTGPYSKSQLDSFGLSPTNINENSIWIQEQ